MGLKTVLLAIAFVSASCGRTSNQVTRVMSLPVACSDAVKARAEVVTAFIDAFAERIRIENEKLAAQGSLHCKGSLIMTDSENRYDPPKGTVDISVSSPTTSSFGSYGFPSSGSVSTGGSSTGGIPSSGGASKDLVFSIKVSVSFPLGASNSVKCQSIYNHPFYTAEAFKLVNQPEFNQQLIAACAK